MGGEVEGLPKCMAVSTRIIRRRIKSITNTKKITKAMGLVSGAKMRRAVQAVLGTRPYATLAWDVVTELRGRVDRAAHPLLRESGKREKLLIIAMFSDRGLCGGYNAQLVRRLRTFVHLHATGTAKIDVVAIGRRGIDAFRRAGMSVVAAFTNISNNPTWAEVRPISKIALETFTKGAYDEILLVYTDFRSVVSQISRVRTLLPLRPEAVTDELGAIGVTTKPTPPWAFYEYMFEPNADEVLSAMLPRLVETQVYQAVLESAASEHSARMFAMQNATRAAHEMIDDLTFTFNQARQAVITREIAEISAGKAALE